MRTVEQNWEVVFNENKTVFERLNAACLLMDDDELSLEGYTSLWMHLIDATE